MKKLTKSVLAVVLSATFTVSYAQKSKVDSSKTKDIEGVVVTALGIKREKKSLGYASQEIKADALSEGTTNTGNFASQLSGKVAGLNVTTTSNFGGSANLLIRGVKSLGGGNPLIVIDGSPVNNASTYTGYVDYGNALSDISQDDIESLNVLKGAAASALYGERGLNGVIVITTKSGRGKQDNSWGATFNTGVTVGSVDATTFPKYQTQYGAGYGGQVFSDEDYAADGIPYGNFSSDASYGPKFDANQLVYQWYSFDPTNANYGKATPWVAAKNGPISFFNKAITYTNSISLAKGDKTKNILFSYDNYNTSGIVPNSELNKNTFTLKVNYDITEKLHASFYTTLTLQNTTGRSIAGYSDNLMSGFRQWWQTNVDINDLKNSYYKNISNPTADNNYGNVTWNRLSSSDGTAAYWNNPYFQAYQNYTADKRNRSFSYGSLTYDINKNINIMGKVSYDRSNLTIERRVAAGSVSQSFGASGNDITSGYSMRQITRTETNYDVMANYKFDITNDINISGVLGGNIRRNDYYSLYSSTEGGLLVPGVYALGNSVNTPLAPDETEYTTQTNSGYVTTSLDFYKIFYLDGTWRIDQSSTLPENNNVYNYSSVTGALILSELIKAPWLKFWKLRGNYAQVGGTADPYQLMNYYTTSGIYNGNVAIFGTQTSRANAELKPQKSSEYEFGTELRFLNDRITFDAAYYKTQTKDQIVSLPVSSTTGYTTKVINAGKIENSGVEFQLGLKPIKSKDFSWDINVNWSKNKNKVVELADGVSNLLLNSMTGGVSLNATVGEAWGTLRGTDYTYDSNGNKIVALNSGGKYRYVTKSSSVIGNANPDWIGGIRNSFSYKNLSLSFLIDVRKGGDIFSTDLYYGLATGIYPETVAGTIRTTGAPIIGVTASGEAVNTSAGGSTYATSGGYKIYPTSEFVYDGSFVKLREASITYTLPKSVIANTFLTDAKISLVGRNLWIIHKNLPYADPESVVAGGLYSYGWSIGSLPTTRDIGVNITVKF